MLAILPINPRSSSPTLHVFRVSLRRSTLRGLVFAPLRFLDDHLCHSLPAEGFASHEALALDTGQGVEGRGEGEQDGGGDQAGRFLDDTEPLDQAHAEVDGGAEVVGGESPHEGVKGRRRRTDSEKQGDLDEDDEERAYAVDS